MSERPQIHIFVGAPSIPRPREGSEQSSAPAGEQWRELRFLCNPGFVPGTLRGAAAPSVPQAESSTPTGVPSSGDRAQQGRFMAREGKDLPSPAPVALTCTSTPKKSTSLTCSDCEESKDTFAPANVDQAADEHLPQGCAESAGQEKPSGACCPELTERKAPPSEISSSDISALVASTEQVSIHLRSVGLQAARRSECHEHLSPCMDVFFQKSQESKPKEPNDCADFAVSADTEFRSVVTLSQVAVFAQNEMQESIVKLSETEAGKKAEEGQYDHFQCDSGVGTCTTAVTGNEYEEEDASSLELFSSEDDGENVSIKAIKQEESAQENAEKFQELNVPAEQLVNGIHIEPLSSGIRCSQGNCSHKNSSKRPLKHEDSSHLSHSAFKRQLKSKRAKLNSSPPGSGVRVDPDGMAEFKKLQKKLSLLKNCCSKNQKYNILVTVVHPCHIKEIQKKTKPKSSCKVPVATIVVIDQSEIERKVVLWRGAAFWSLTVFPGDIILLTDIIMYENPWCGEVMLQSTFTSQLLNLGNCSALNTEKVYPLVDDGVLHGLLAYISSEFPHFRDIPQRQVQRLDDVEYVQLDQLQPSTLVHSVLKIINISVLTESVYSYRGGSQKKIFLTVEQNRDQHYRMVLWGSGAAWYPQLQRKKGVVQVKAHILELKFTISTGQYKQLVFSADTSLECVLASLPMITYSGCAKCGLELQADENMIYKQCVRCLPYSKVKTFYRPALMTVEDEGYEIYVHVVSELVEKIFLNIPADWLKRLVVPSSDITYSTIVADLCHSLLADTEASYLLEIRSHFVLDENSYPLQKDFHLLNFHPEL
ncbi:shieldin complex subunit 2 [Pyrgilauda ruficollis]|uniref:shieldin complex subunit 2 n=1 Tax=Pyrgilauda ruficollis TaxID=221976 RepID=UPI001B87C739|nr:shieldin complex subunit 2 [Pyrgilauda ruficollis]